MAAGGRGAASATAEVLVAWADPQDLLHRAARGGALAWLAADERERMARPGAGEAGVLHAAARLLLRALLARMGPLPAAGWCLRRDARGRPVVTGEPSAAAPAVALAHTRGCALAAAARGALVGVDVERTDRRVRVDAVARRFFAPAEAAELARLPAEARRRAFLRRWTVKEAVLKATGEGIAGGLQSVVVAEVAGSLRLDFAAPRSDDPARWRLVPLETGPAHVATLAARAQRPGGPRVTVVSASEFV